MKLPKFIAAIRKKWFDEGHEDKPVTQPMLGSPDAPPEGQTKRKASRDARKKIRRQERRK